MYPYPGKCVDIGRVLCIMPGMPTHLVQELNDGTVLYVGSFPVLGKWSARRRIKRLL